MALVQLAADAGSFCSTGPPLNQAAVRADLLPRIDIVFDERAASRRGKDMQWRSPRSRLAGGQVKGLGCRQGVRNFTVPTTPTQTRCAGVSASAVDGRTGRSQDDLRQAGAIAQVDEFARRDAADLAPSQQRRSAGLDPCAAPRSNGTFVLNGSSRPGSGTGMVGVAKPQCKPPRGQKTATVKAQFSAAKIDSSPSSD